MIIIRPLIISLLQFLFINLPAQEQCSFKEPVVKIDFGSGNDIHEPGIFSNPQYKRDYSICPDDGHYAFVSKTQDCFNKDWFTLNEDHTTNDRDGIMMIVNASEKPTVFFNSLIPELKPNTTYLFSVWLMNVCRIKGTCPPMPASLIITIKSPGGKKIAEFETGRLTQTITPRWQKYSGIFRTPNNAGSLVLLMSNKVRGGCGNDFAMDDIQISECIKQIPAEILQEIPREEEDSKKPVVINKTPEPEKIIVQPKPRKEIPVTVDEDTSVPVGPRIQTGSTIPTPPPDLLVSRKTEVAERIETSKGDIRIDLYDNAQIDGDTITIFHNNKMIVSHAGLSDVPITIMVTLDELHPHHEVVMVADNLGSIPPNTSMMVVTTTKKRYEIFVSSSEQKNAKLVIDLERE